MAERFWRIKRMRRLEADAMNAENFDDFLKLLPLIQRTMAAAERGFHKALAALQKSQKAHGFVPQISMPESVAAPEIGFVPEIPQPEPETSTDQQTETCAEAPDLPLAA